MNSMQMFFLIVCGLFLVIGLALTIYMTMLKQKKYYVPNGGDNFLQFLGVFLFVVGLVGVIVSYVRNKSGPSQSLSTPSQLSSMTNAKSATPL